MQKVLEVDVSEICCQGVTRICRDRLPGESFFLPEFPVEWAISMTDTGGTFVVTLWWRG